MVVAVTTTPPPGQAFSVTVPKTDAEAWPTSRSEAAAISTRCRQIFVVFLPIGTIVHFGSPKAIFHAPLFGILLFLQRETGL
jgi:hypothetical protein